MRRNRITSAVLKPGAVCCDRCDFRYSALVHATIEASCAGPLGFPGSLTFLLFAMVSRGGLRCVNGTLANGRTWAGSSSDTFREHSANTRPSAQNAGKQILNHGILGVGTKLPSTNQTIALQHRENRTVLRHPIGLPIIPFLAPTNVACRFERMINAQHITRYGRHTFGDVVAMLFEIV